MAEISEVTLQSFPEFKVIVSRYRYAHKYDEVSLTPDFKHFWFKLWKAPEIEITLESFERWFLVLFPEGTVDVQEGIVDTGFPKPKTYLSRLGDSDLVVKKFLP